MWLLLTISCLGAICAVAQSPQRYDVVIHEIMADPSPVVGLPEAEFVELKNRSAAAINLQGWRLTTASATSGMLGNFLLQPDSLVILCATAQQAAFSRYGTVLPVPSFPALANEGAILSLISKE